MCYCDIIRTVETVALGLLVLMHVHVCVTVFFLCLFLPLHCPGSLICSDSQCIQCIHMYILTNAWIFMKVTETDSRKDPVCFLINL